MEVSRGGVCRNVKNGKYDTPYFQEAAAKFMFIDLTRFIAYKKKQNYKKSNKKFTMHVLHNIYQHFMCNLVLDTFGKTRCVLCS